MAVWLLIRAGPTAQSDATVIDWSDQMLLIWCSWMSPLVRATTFEGRGGGGRAGATTSEYDNDGPATHQRRRPRSVAVAPTATSTLPQSLPLASGWWRAISRKEQSNQQSQTETEEGTIQKPQHEASWRQSRWNCIITDLSKIRIVIIRKSNKRTE